MEYEYYEDVIDAYEAGIGVEPGDSLTDYIRKNNIKIIIPMSYGVDEEYTLLVKQEYEKVFGSKVSIVDKMMPFTEYVKFLNDIDIGIYPHNRQQAGNNIMIMLALGKKVYINNENTNL